MRGRWHWQMYAGWERVMIRRNFDRIIFASEASLELGIRMGARPELSVVNDPGIDPERFKPEPKDGTVLYAGKYEGRLAFSVWTAAMSFSTAATTLKPALSTPRSRPPAPAKRLKARS